MGFAAFTEKPTLIDSEINELRKHRNKGILMKDNIVVFKKKQEFKPETEKTWGSIKGQVYHRLMSAGLPQSLADEFLEEFRPTFEEMIFPSFDISLTLPDDECLQEEFMDMAKLIEENMNNYSSKVIGMVAHKDLIIFLQQKKISGEL